MTDEVYGMTGWAWTYIDTRGPGARACFEARPYRTRVQAERGLARWLAGLRPDEIQAHVGDDPRWEIREVELDAAGWPVKGWVSAVQPTETIV